jgi:hypothetical protein
VRLLLAFGFHPNDRGANDDTALHCIVRVSSEDSLDITKELIKQGANVNLQNASGCTALHEAAFSNSGDCIEVLLAVRANPNLVNGEGLTARDCVLQMLSQKLKDEDKKAYKAILLKLLKPGGFSTRKVSLGGKDHQGPSEPDEEAIGLLPTQPPSYDPRKDLDISSDYKGFSIPYDAPTDSAGETADPVAMTVRDMIYGNGISDSKCSTRHRMWFHLPLNHVSFLPTLQNTIDLVFMDLTRSLIEDMGFCRSPDSCTQLCAVTSF